MIAIQYRDSETEVLLRCELEEEIPPIGRTVRIGLHEYRVLYRWRGGPGATTVYVHRPTETAPRAA